MSDAERRAAIAGVGMTDLVRQSDRSVLALAAEASHQAIADAGLRPADIDGILTYSVMGDSTPASAVATTLGCGELSAISDLNYGGQAPCMLADAAAGLVTSGRASAVLVYRAMLGRSGVRLGAQRFPAGAGQFRDPIGFSSYPIYMAMWIQRYLHDVGGSEADLAAVVFASRHHAERNPRAVRRRPLDMDAYRASPFVATPLREVDCTIEVDGAAAFVVTTLERARDLARPPAVIAGAAYRSVAGIGIDIGDHLCHRDYSHNYAAVLREALYRSAGMGPEDIQIAQIYDCFSGVFLMTLEDIGLCRRGEAAEFVRSGGTLLDGALPTNTGGGLLAEGYLHGMNTLIEAVVQVQGRAGERQALRHETCLVTSGAATDGSAMILSSD